MDAEALQTIKLQRAKARAEGYPPQLGGAGPAAAPPGGRATPPPAGDGPGISPFASATSQGMARTPSASNLAALHGHGGAAALGQATSLPISMQPRGLARRSPSGTPPAGAPALGSGGAAASAPRSGPRACMPACMPCVAVRRLVNGASPATPLSLIHI